MLLMALATCRTLLLYSAIKQLVHCPECRWGKVMPSDIGKCAPPISCQAEMFQRDRYLTASNIIAASLQPWCTILES